jgi:hypothetical protein|tara:strand:+ start:8256 stop:8861 length:606 start_codon:yes stop_codon:yes gene_type:complete
MTATAAPFGLRPIGRLGGGTVETRAYPILSSESTRICYGDVVKLTDAGATTTIQKDTGTTTATPIGIFLGCQFIDLNSKQLTFSQQWSGAANTEGMAFVVDDPAALFAIQADATVNNDDLAANAALVQGASNADLSISRVSLDISTAATTNTLPLRIVDWLGGYNGDEYGTAFPIMVCRFNAGHQLSLIASGSTAAAPSAA